MADLARQIRLPIECDFFAASSYGNRMRSVGRVRLGQRPSTPIAGRDVIVVDTVVDTGRTLKAVLAALRKLKPRSVAVCALLKKPGPTRVDFLGFRIPGRFVVGYGLDLAGRFRNLPFVAAWEDR
jgi:hypoxanthine phosphoribosyltransferase